MLSKNDIRDAVHFLLREEAEASLLRKDPDVYYGWVPPTDEHDGYWLGEADERSAEYQLDLALVGLKAAGENTWSDPENPALVTAYELAKARVESCRTALDDVKAYRDRVISGRREQLINRRVAKLFLKTYRKAVKLDWDLYNPAIPQSLRDYCLRQLARGPLAPVSVVFLYLSVQSTLEHGADFQTEAITGQDYLIDNPLVSGGLDIDVPEDAPKAKQRRAYIRELQAQAIRDRRAPAHENRDPRDVLADFEYHGLPEQLGAMWINKDENCCDHCKQGVRVRMIHTSSGYRYATVCPNFRDEPRCHYELESPEFETRKALREWAMVEYATKQAA
jgi:hypothetical protein